MIKKFHLVGLMCLTLGLFFPLDGEESVSAAVDPSQPVQIPPSRVYVSALLAGTVAVIDAETDMVVGKPVRVRGNPCGIAVTPDGRKVYVSIRNLRDLGASNEVAVINAITQEVTRVVVGRDPHGVSVSPDGTRAYVANYFMDNSLSVIDTLTDEVIETIPVGEIPGGVVVSPDGQRVYVANANTREDEPPQQGSVSVIDVESNQVVAMIPVGRQPVGVAVSPDSSTLYVTNFADDTVSVIDTTNNLVVATVVVGNGPSDLKVSLDGTKVFVANTGTANPIASGTVSVIDTTQTPMTTTITIKVGRNPIGVGITADGTKIYVASSGTGTVTVINTATASVERTIKGVGLGACGVAVGPVPTGL